MKQQLFKQQINELNRETYSMFKNLIYRETGISMGDNKRILVSNRLRKRLLALGLTSYEEYYNFLVKKGHENNEIVRFIDAVSTNETYFYRGDNQFQALEEIILPELFKKRKKISIWSAGCSTGEEPYTIQMVFSKTSNKHDWRGYSEIYATDLSNEVIEKAKRAVYSGRTLNLLPDEFKTKYFDMIDEDVYRVKEAIRKKVIFKSHNLLKQSPPHSQFDIIFCRNVMIYFDRETQKHLVDNVFAKVLSKDGYLFIGHSESLIGKSENFQYAHVMRSPIYKFKDINKKRGEK